MSLAGSTALVTGGLGFIGNALATRLESLGVEVHTASRRSATAPATARHWQVDLSDMRATARLIGEVRPSHVFHLASHVMGAPDLAHVLPAFHGNLQSTVNLLVALSEVGCRRMITTGSLVEPEPGERALPNSPYAAAKWASSDYSRMFHALYGFPIAIARVFMVYGPGQLDMTKLVPYVISSVLRGQAPKISSGTHSIDWIYIDDVIEGFVRLATAPGVEGQSVDFGSGQPITTKKLVTKLCRLLGSGIDAEFGALPDRPMEPIRVADIATANRRIGWSPVVGLDDGLSKTIAWYRKELNP